MKKSVFIVLIAIMLSACVVSALKAGIVIESDDKTYYDCISINSGDSVYDLLKSLDSKRSDISLVIDGELTRVYYLRSVNGLSPKTENGRYYGWNYFIFNEENDQFTSPDWSFGIGDYKITKEEVIGLKYGYEEFVNPPLDWTVKTPPEKPKFVSFDQVCNNPQVNVTKVYVDGKSQTGFNKGGGKIKDVLPGSIIEFRIKFENLYSGSTDIGINDISVDGTFEEVNSEADIVESLNDFNLAAGREESKSLKFTVPLNAESKDRLLKIEISANDDAGIRYERTLIYDVRIERKPHQLKITNAGLNKEAFDCGENALLSVSVLNLGEEKESVKLKIINDELGISIGKAFELSNEPSKPAGSYEDRINLAIPSGINKKAYTLDVIAEYGNNSESEKVNFAIGACEGSKSEAAQKEQGEPESLQVGEIIVGSAIPEEKTAGKIKAENVMAAKLKSEKNDYYAIIGIIVLLIVTIAALVTLFFILKK